MELMKGSRKGCSPSTKKGYVSVCDVCMYVHEFACVPLDTFLLLKHCLLVVPL